MCSGSGIYQICISLMSPVCPLLQYLISEGPGCPDTLLDVFDEAVTGLQTRVVVQGRPDLTANLLKHKPERSIFCIPASPTTWREREF